MPHSEETAENAFNAESWLQAFDAASPLQRQRLLTKALQSGEPFANSADREPLVAATVLVSQLLAEHNLLAQLRELIDLVEQGAPDVHAALLPAMNHFLLQDALYGQQGDQALGLLEALIAQVGSETGAAGPELAGEEWQAMLSELTFYGRAVAAAGLANRLERRLGEDRLAKDEDLAYALEQHQVFAAIESFWRSAQTDTDHETFLRALQAADIEDIEDLRALTELRDRPAASQLGKVRQSFRERDCDAALLPAQLAFGRWMLENHELNLFTSAWMMEQAFGLWQLAPEKGRPEFSKWGLIKSKDFLEYCDGLGHHEALDGFVLLWGLPLVCSWLQEQGLANLLVSRHLLSLLPQARAALMQERRGDLWTAAFVLHWPAGLPDQEAETAAFAASREQSTPLSDDPQDSLRFRTEG